jgi:hypothetical protein
MRRLDCRQIGGDALPAAIELSQIGRGTLREAEAESSFLGGEDRKRGSCAMSELAGVSIEEITAFGWSEDGQHIWVTHKLRDGSEYRLVYPYIAAGQLITMVAHAAGSASSRRASRDPGEAAEGMDSAALPIEEVRIGSAPDGTGAMLHMTTADNVPIALALPLAQLEELAEQAQKLSRRLRDASQPKTRLH